MQFNPDPNRRAKMKLFSPVVSNNLLHPPVKFNSSRITRCSHQKYLGVVLDLKLNFSTHIDQKIKKCDKMIGLMRQLSVNLPCDALLTVYTSFIRPHLDYGGILYHKPNERFQNKMEKFNIELA